MSVDPDLSREEIDRIAVEAYLFFYPLVLMETTRRVMTNWSYQGVGPMGTLVHARAFPVASARVVVRPNFDTLYSSTWLDLSSEPYVISLPAIPDRFFMFPVYDMWTDVFASPGTRTNGIGPFSFALCTPQWRGELPEGVERIDAPTPLVWIIGRTETRNVADYDYIHSIQNQMRLAPLSTWPERAPVDFERDAEVDMKTPPMIQVEKMSAREFFAVAARTVASNRPHSTDWGMLARLERVGFVIGEQFDLEVCNEHTVGAFDSAASRAREQMRDRAKAMALVNGWSSIEDMGVYGNAYLKRAMTANWGLGANPPEESLYPHLQVDGDGNALDGHHRYLLRFGSDELPPVDAFWSLTVYDRQGYQVANEIDRFALGDRDEMVIGADGSLEILLQHERPGDEWFPNWLPVPRDLFVATLRLYLPRESATSRRWAAPAAIKLD